MLAFLELAGGCLSKLDFQKLLFLYHQKRSASFYEFIPYLYGCYSFQANADLESLDRQQWLKVSENDIQLLKKPVTFRENRNDIKTFLTAYSDLRGNDLIKSVYRSYPYYTINSIISKKILSRLELDMIRAERKLLTETAPKLFTLGYEGISFESYLNILIKNNIKLLCDVRNNPLSRKFGFSKNMLATILPKLDIAYAHIPELGIVSAKRKQLKGPISYQSLFTEYENELPEKHTYVVKVVELLREHRRIALTCFEKDPHFCHRSILGRFITENYSIPVFDL